MGRRFDFTIYLADEREEIEKSLTPEEKAVFESGADDELIVKTAFELHRSEATIKRRRARVAWKIEQLHKRAARREHELNEMISE